MEGSKPESYGGKKSIEARVLKGFRDSLPYGPQGEKRRRRIIGILGDLFELAGFAPIDTPALELCEVLLGKAGGETEKQIYRFRDNGAREVALRFDLTVPLARFVVQHAEKLNFPFKRYHMAKVWRGENTQQGRYREFYQCDLDIVGDASILADLCVLQTVWNALAHLRRDYPALGHLRLHVNHRGLLGAFWQFCGVAEQQQAPALRIIDKFHKVGREAAGRELKALLGPAITENLLAYLDSGLEPQEWARSSEAAKMALAELRQLADFAGQIGMELHFDPSIVRGLDYYTGMVFETFLAEFPSLGSICSGGRYDQLTQLYSKNPMPGVGASIGLDRLLAGLEELETESTAEAHGCMIISPDPEWKTANGAANLACLRLSQQLQENGQACDVVPRPKKMSILFQRAAVQNSRYLLLLQPNFSWQLRNLASRKSLAVFSATEILQFIHSDSG